MEVSFGGEVRMLRRGAGETFHGEGILAVTKALLQSGVAYVGGYQGAPVSHLLDVLVQAKDYLDELGVHVEACANEASAAAMLGASIHYPLRGAVTWKSIVGTNVAADALSNLASPGVIGGALIIVGEDYGEGARVIQERTLRVRAQVLAACCSTRGPTSRTWCAWSSRRSRCRRPSNTPAMLELRIRACHVRGSFARKDNVAAGDLDAAPARRARRRSTTASSRIRRSTYRQEKLKYDERMPAARRYIVEHALNERLRRRRATTSASSCRAGSTTR